jgi:hypothetical protein
MRSTDNHDPNLFLAPPATAEDDNKAEEVDSSAEAMKRLRDPFATGNPADQAAQDEAHEDSRNRR